MLQPRKGLHTLLSVTIDLPTHTVCTCMHDLDGRRYGGPSDTNKRGTL